FTADCPAAFPPPPNLLDIRAATGGPGGKGKHMLRHHQQFIRSLALTGMAIAALIAPHAASARPVADPQHVLQAKHIQIDLRTPDAVTPVEIQPTKVDLRSPDAATPVQRPQANVGLRSRDTQVPVQPTAPRLGAPVAQPTST